MNEWLKGRQLSRSNNVLRLTGTGRTEKGGVADDDVVKLGSGCGFSQNLLMEELSLMAAMKPWLDRVTSERSE